MALALSAICAAVSAHYSAKFNHPISCRYDNGKVDDCEAHFEIHGRGIPAAPAQAHRFPNGWEMRDSVSWLDAVNLTLAAQQAAAPEMLAAATRVLQWIDAGCDPSTKSLDALRAAIALATGAPTGEQGGEG